MMTATATATAKTDALLKRLCSQVLPTAAATLASPPTFATLPGIRCHLMLRVRHEEPFKYCIFTYISVVVLRAACYMKHEFLHDSCLSYSCCNALLGNVSTMKTPTAEDKCNQVVAERDL